MAKLFRFAALPLSVASISSCAGPSVDLDLTGRLAIEVAPLTLPGITNADWGISVSNGAGQTVWSRPTLSADNFGDGAGGLTFVGACDASSPSHVVALTLNALYEDENLDGTNETVPTTEYKNPCPSGTPCTVAATCSENQDTAVQFNLTVMRDANQGFFDIGINFEDIFCSAKVDCRPAFLHDDSGNRVAAAVVGFACASGQGTESKLHIYLDAVAGSSTQHLLTATRGNVEGPVRDYSVYRDNEEMAGYDKGFINFAVEVGTGLDISGNATASTDNFPSSAGYTAYPVIGFNVSVPQNCSGFSAHELDAVGSGVKTKYVSNPGAYAAWESFDTDNLSSSTASSCAAHLAAGATTSGVYSLDPDGTGGFEAFSAYCDMTTDGGGWTLVGKVNVANSQLAEPRTWFTNSTNVSDMLTPSMTRNAGTSSLGTARLLPLLTATSLSRFVVIAESNFSQTAKWFKRVASAASFSAWFDNDTTPSSVCTNVAMSTNCSTGIVGKSGDMTALEGMNLAVYGYPASGILHLRQDGDGLSYFTGVCSYTFNNAGNAWNDSAFDGHWGNGLLVWLR